MQNGLLKIINNYGAIKQLKYFQSEVYEFTEAVLQHECLYQEDKNIIVPIDIEENFIKFSKDHIAEEIADVMVMLEQFRLYYNISDMKVKDIMGAKIERQLKRIEEEEKC